jgi:hypothetical protein
MVGGRHVGGHVRAGPDDGGDRPGEQCQRHGKHRAADPARGHRSRHERQGHEPLQGEPGEHRERPRDRRPDDDVGGVCGVTHGEIGEPALLSMQASLNIACRPVATACRHPAARDPTRGSPARPASGASVRAMIEVARQMASPERGESASSHEVDHSWITTSQGRAVHASSRSRARLRRNPRMLP